MTNQRTSHCQDIVNVKIPVTYVTNALNVEKLFNAVYWTTSFDTELLLVTSGDGARPTCTAYNRLVIGNIAEKTKSIDQLIVRSNPDCGKLERKEEPLADDTDRHRFNV